MVYIPILKTLEVLLNNDTVLSEVRINYLSHYYDIIYNIRDTFHAHYKHRVGTLYISRDGPDMPYIYYKNINNSEQLKL